MREALYICVYVPEFPAQTLTRLRQEISQAPLVVLAGVPPFEQVCSLNKKAQQGGVERGMTRAELDVFSGLTVLQRSEPEERMAKAALVEAAGTFTPRTEVQSSSAEAFSMVLDMTGTSRLFGSVSETVRCISRSFKTLNVHARFAVSANLRTAVCVAPLASKAPLIVPAGKEKEQLAKLPLSTLNLQLGQADVFALWGIHTLGELAALPEEELVVRLGQEGKRLRLMARGEHPHLMVPEEPAFALEEFLAFDSPVEILDSLLFVLGPMLDQLLARAQGRAFALASVTVKLGLDGGGEHERIIKPALPVLQREVLLKLLHLDLQSNPPPAGVLSVFVHAEPGDRSKVQLGLFAPQLPEPLRLDVTLARIAALVGEQRVGRARLLDTHASDSFAMERFSVPADAPSSETKPRASAALRRCRPPISIEVRHAGQRLAAFTFRGKRYAVQEAYGPWRKSGTWWSADVWSREEWDVRASAGGEDNLLCIVGHDRLRQLWQLEALYD